jgi:deoxyribonuclease-4
MLVGAHVSTAGGLDRAVDRAQALGCETMQIFSQSPRRWQPTAYGEADFSAFRDRLEASSVQSVFIHAVYLINCASDDADTRRRSLAALAHALRVGDAIGSDGVIVHPGSGRGQAPDRTLKLIAGAFEKALDASERCPLLLENTAGSGSTVGRSFSELAELVDLTGGGDRLGVCLDSCHLLASGHDIRTAAERKKVVDRCARELGMKRVRALHLNDSKAPLGSNRDRHANLGDGELGESGIVAFLADRRFSKLPVLLEVPGPDGKGPDKRQVQIAKRLRDRASR